MFVLQSFLCVFDVYKRMYMYSILTYVVSSGGKSSPGGGKGSTPPTLANVHDDYKRLDRTGVFNTFATCTSTIMKNGTLVEHVCHSKRKQPLQGIAITRISFIFIDKLMEELRMTQGRDE